MFTKLFRAVVATLLLFGNGYACAQGYPAKQLRLVVPYRPGASTDGRLLDSDEILFAPGTTAKPLTDHDLRTKFVEWTRALHDIDGNVHYAILSRLETLDDINKLSSRSSKFLGSPVGAPSGSLCHGESS